MSDVYNHSHLVHAFDDCNAEITNSVVTPLCASISDEVARVIRQQRQTLPELVETVDVVRGLKNVRRFAAPE